MFVLLLVLFAICSVTNCCKTNSFNDLKVQVTLDLGYSVNFTISGCVLSPPNFQENNNAGWLEKIHCSGQSISTLERDVVSKYSRLMSIELPRNGIVGIKNRAFFKLVKLKTVLLNNNRIEYLENGIFQNTPNLKFLRLDNNCLARFQQSWLSNIPKLTFLNLTFNAIESLQGAAFNTMKQVTYLMLGHNLISSLQGNSFNGMPQLKVLDLGYNRISSVANAAFQSPSNTLQVLNLFRNRISNVHDRILGQWSKIPVVIIRFNPISCTCLDSRIIQLTNGRCTETEIKKKIFKCLGMNDFQNIPMCVMTNETLCSTSYSELMNSIMDEHIADYECYLDKEKVTYYVLQ